MSEIDQATPSRFFYTGGALPPEAPSYIPRHADDQLFERLLHGDYCYILVSRQMGKSSLMVHTLTRLVQQNITAVMVDLNSIGDDTTQEQWYYSLIEQLAGQLGLNEQIDSFWDRSESKTALQKWVGALEQLVRLHSDRSLVIFIDEIDQVRSLPFKTDEFFAAIRSFHNRRAMDANFKRLTFCLIGVALPSDLIEDSRITPFNIAERIDLTDFTEDQVIALKTGLQRDEIQDEVLLQRVFYWTNGHPYLTQRLCRAIVEDASVQTAQDIDRLCGRLFFGADGATPDDNINLVSARLLHSDPDVAGLLTLHKRIVQGKSAHYDRANRLVNILMLAGAIRSLGGNLQIRNRIYSNVFDATWIADNMPNSEKRRLQQARRTGRLQVAAIALPIVLLLTALTMIAIFYAHQSHKLTTDLRGALKQSRENGILANKQADAANRYRYIANMNLVQQAWEKPPFQMGHIQELLQEPPNYKERGFEWFYWNHLCHLELMTLEGHTGYVNSVAFSPDGKRIVTGSDDKTARIWDAQTGREILALKGLGYVASVAFSPDGKRIVTGSLDEVDMWDAKIWDAHTGKETLTIEGGKDLITSVIFSADSKRLLFGSEDNTAKVWDVQTGQETLTLTGHTGPVWSAHFSSDGNRIVTGSLDGTFRVWNTR